MNGSVLSVLGATVPACNDKGVGRDEKGRLRPDRPKCNYDASKNRVGLLHCFFCLFVFGVVGSRTWRPRGSNRTATKQLTSHRKTNGRGHLSCRCGVVSTGESQLRQTICERESVRRDKNICYGIVGERDKGAPKNPPSPPKKRSSHKVDELLHLRRVLDVLQFLAFREVLGEDLALELEVDVVDQCGLVLVDI